MQLTYQQAYEWGCTQLQAISDTPKLDAQWLLSHASGQSQTYLWAYPEVLLEPDVQEAFLVLLKAREQWPLAYVIGKCEWYGLEFSVNSNVLVPRPDTESLIEWIESNIQSDVKKVVLDLGTGSGAIAITLKTLHPHWEVHASDVSPAALQQAQRNAKVLELHWHEGSWFKAIPKDARFDVIVSNPPYLAESDPHLLHDGVRAEPRISLVSGPTGLEAYEIIAQHAKQYLKENGVLVLEHGVAQQEAIIELLSQAGFGEVAGHQDLSGNKRFVSCF